MAADLGTHVNRGKKGTGGVDKDVVVDGGLERSDIGRWIVSNIAMERDKSEEVLVYKFFLGVPKFLVVLVDDCVLVWVVVSGGGTGRGSEKLRKKGSSDGVRYWFDGKRWERSGWLQSGGMGRWYLVDRGK